MKNFIGILLIFVGIVSIVLGGYLLWQRYNPNKLSFTVRSDLRIQKAGNIKPIRLQIVKYGIDTPVIPARIIRNNWQMTDQGASFLTSTVAPGEKGNSVIYGHNYANILGKLPQVKPGDKIVVTMNDGNRITFKVENTQEVTPDQTHILNQTKEPRLTIYTCSGLFDSKRFVAVASKV